MKKSYSILVIIVFAFILLSAGCEGNQQARRDFDIPEVEKIQKMLDDMSVAIMENNPDRVAGGFSDGCPRLQLELSALRKLMESAKIENYTQTVVNALRLKDGVVCTVNIDREGTAGGKSINSRSVRNMYFVFDSGAWRIGDYNYYPYTNPTVVVGSQSALYDSAYMLSEIMGSKLRNDTEHLQSYGDIIMVGTPYDNASILDLEEKGLTPVKVTDDYPGNDAGIVQVLSNAENYRHVILIQGSSLDTAEGSVRFMADYMKDNPYLNPGVYFIEEEGIRKATPLEMTTLVSLDMDKASQRLKEVQKHMEENLSVMEEELQAEKEQLLREQRFLDNIYREDFNKAFSRYEFYPEQSLYDSMVLMNANYTDSRLCATAFELPYGSSLGTAYAYADYSYRSIDILEEDQDDRGLLLGGNTVHTLAAHEITNSANKLEASALGISLLRLAGFLPDELYNVAANKDNAVFFNIGSGYAAVPGNPVLYTPELQLPIGEIHSVYNDAGFLSIADDFTNLNPDEIKMIYEKAGGLFKLSGRLPKETSNKVPFRKSELEEKLGMPYSAEDIYGLLRNTFATDDSPCAFSTLDEARDKLRAAMGNLLAVKCTRYIVGTASRYPASQFDYARYAAGLIDVEHPNAYAEASLNSKLIKGLGGGISNLLSDTNAKTQKIIDVLGDIADEERNSDMLFFPDYCISNKKGSHVDKALLAFGLYSQLTGSTEDTFIALGEGSSYLVFKEKDQWKYLDCRYNTVRDYIDDDISAAFNKDFVYNERLGIGAKPEFAK